MIRLWDDLLRRRICTHRRPWPEWDEVRTHELMLPLKGVSRAVARRCLQKCSVLPATKDYSTPPKSLRFVACSFSAGMQPNRSFCIMSPPLGSILRKLRHVHSFIPYYLTSILIVSFPVRLDVSIQNCIYPGRFQINIQHKFLISTMRATCPTRQNSSSLNCHNNPKWREQMVNLPTA